MYLSKLALNPRNRQVQRELANPYQLHRTLMKGFPESLPADERVLHRLDVDPRSGEVTVLVQSLYEPNWQPLVKAGNGHYLRTPPPPPKKFDPMLKAGRRLRFRLRANPTVKTRSERNPSKKTRVPLKKEEQQTEWLDRKAAQHGFRVVQVQVAKLGDQTGRIKREEESHTLHIYTVQFDGILQVTDPERFNHALRHGIGPAKSFGCGLLSLARE